jgi:hypothetical protein
MKGKGIRWGGRYGGHIQYRAGTARTLREANSARSARDLKIETRDNQTYKSG